MTTPVTAFAERSAEVTDADAVFDAVRRAGRLIRCHQAAHKVDAAEAEAARLQHPA
eukprot:gene11347-4431_t